MAGPVAPPRHLVYVRRDRTHEVHAEVEERGGSAVLVTTEFTPGNPDPADAYLEETPLLGPEDVSVRLADLEERLSLSGDYLRTDPVTREWTPLAPPAKPVDLRAMELHHGPTSTRVYHFHGTKDDRLVLGVPRPDVEGRWVLADVAFQFARGVDDAGISIKHPRLAPELLVSRIAHEHVEMPRRGYQKLYDRSQYEEAYGPGWQGAMRRTFEVATDILLRRRPVAPVAPAEPALPADVLAAQRATMSRNVRATCARYLSDSEQETLVDVGEFAIRRWAKEKRRRIAQTEQYHLSIVEASLLVRHALRADRLELVRDEGPKLARFAR